MKIMQINCVYKKGSTGKIVYDIHSKLLDNEYDSIVCYGRGNNLKEENTYKAAPEFIMKMQSLRSRITGYIYAGCIISTYNIIKLIKKEKPDIVHLHCINGYMVNIYKVLTFLKKEDIHTIITFHAEFFYTAGCGYAYECNQWVDGCLKTEKICPQFNKNRPKSWVFNRCNAEWEKMEKSFNRFDNLAICTVSDWLRDRAKMSSFLKDKKIVTVKNGLDSEIFTYRYSNTIREKHNIKDEKILLHVTPDFNSPIKGGRYVLEVAKRLKNDNIKIIVVGFNGEFSSLPSNIIPISHTNNQIELAEYYSMADLTLLTSKKETFSMVCAESLCCGTQIVGFEAGGPETISIKEYSSFVEYGDVDKLEREIRSNININCNKALISDIAKKIYDKQSMFEGYEKVYRGFK